MAVGLVASELAPAEEHGELRTFGSAASGPRIEGADATAIPLDV
jgi:hypothetical protein